MLKKGDFVEINFIGKIKENNEIFDLTYEDIAKENNLYNKDMKYKPVIICLGFNDIIKGLDKGIIGKEIGKYIIEIRAEDGFGKKSHDMIKLLPTSLFTKNNIQPVKGLQVNLDGFIGRIISVSGGRTVVDLNHPLAGKELIYEVEILRVISDLKEKIEGILRMLDDKFDFEIDNDKLIINGMDKNLEKVVEKRVKERISEIKTIDFKI